MVVVTLIVYALLAIYEFVPLYKEKRWREFYVNLVLSVISLVLAFLISINVKVPSPLKPIEPIIYSLIGKQEGK